MPPWRDVGERRGDGLERGAVRRCAGHGPEEGEDRDLRKFRRALEAAMGRSRRRQDRAVGGLARGMRDEFVAAGLAGVGWFRAARKAVALVVDLVAFVAPDAGDLGQDMAEARPAVARLLGESRCRPRRARRRGSGTWSSGQPPCSPSMQRLHIDAVDIRALFAVDLDVDEVGVHEMRRFRDPRSSHAP